MDMEFIKVDFVTISKNIAKYKNGDYLKSLDVNFDSSIHITPKYVVTYLKKGNKHTKEFFFDKLDKAIFTYNNLTRNSDNEIKTDS